MAVAGGVYAQPVHPPTTQPVLAMVPFQARPLQADELLLIYNRNNSGSVQLAEYYMKARQVPANQMLAVDVHSEREEISAADFASRIRQPVRTYLEQHQLVDKVRCLVTFYGVPIRVGKQKLSGQNRKLLNKWRKEFLQALEEFERAIVKLIVLGGGPIPTPRPKRLTEKDYQRLGQDYIKWFSAAQQRILKMAGTAEGKQLQDEFVRITEQTEGLAKIVSALQPLNESFPGAADQWLGQMYQDIQSMNVKVRNLLSGDFNDPARDESRPLVRKYHGLVGLLAILNGDMKQIAVDETHAAVDSELMLLWWDDYPKNRWVANTLNWRFRVNPVGRRFLPVRYWNRPVSLVSRIDGPTPQIAGRMIYDAIMAEREGMSGKVYIDARGLTGKKRGFAEYDENLRDLASLLQQKTKLSVGFDNRDAVFAPGQCPNTMLYCGWYSLRKYVDAFDFIRGSVGYHIASFEAISLKLRNERGWCKSMLADGVTATLGAVAEPYLQSFPRPTDLFGLLLTGRFTLAECYAYTVNYNSWMIMLLGDPLYRPFNKNPYLTIEQVYEPEVIPTELKSQN
jgi:uncharacterized protein (TIGR03790 family)